MLSAVLMYDTSGKYSQLFLFHILISSVWKYEENNIIYKNTSFFKTRLTFGFRMRTLSESCSLACFTLWGLLHKYFCKYDYFFWDMTKYTRNEDVSTSFSRVFGLLPSGSGRTEAHIPNIAAAFRASQTLEHFSSRPQVDCRPLHHFVLTGEGNICHIN